MLVSLNKDKKEILPWYFDRTQRLNGYISVKQIRKMVNGVFS